MSTRRSRQLGNKYIRAEDIQNLIYESDEENNGSGIVSLSNKVTETRIRDGEIDDRLGIDFPEIGSTEWESKRLNESLRDLYGHPGNKLNNSASNQARKSIFNFFKSDNKNTLDDNKVGLDEVSDEFNPRQEVEEPNEEETSLSQTVKKRTSSASTGVGSPKRSKVESENEVGNAPALKPLQIELELEKNRRSEPFKKRTMEAIVQELDQIGMKWKESNSKCSPTLRWGQPITRHCSEKWDLHYFPPKILEAYRKRSDGIHSPSHGITEMGYDCPGKIVEARGIAVDAGRADEEGAEPFEYEQCRKFSNSDDSNSYGSDCHESMTTRSRNQDRRSIDAGMCEPLPRGKGSRKSQRGNKDQKKQINSNRQFKDRFQESHRQYLNDDATDSNKIQYIKSKYDDYGSSSQMSKSHNEETSPQGPTRMNDEEDQVACPICHDKYKKHLIESHANQCATAKFKD